MTLLQALREIILLWAFWAIICISGAAFIRRWSEPPLEVLTGIVLHSLAAAGFIAFIAYVCNASLNLAAVLLILVGCAGLILRRREFVRLLCDYDIRRTLAALLLVQLSILCAVASIRSYSGADWYWDWFEHYQRSRFFAEHWSPESYFGPYKMTARPPLGNALAGLALAVFGSKFFNYQISMAFFSGLLLLPVLLIGRVFLRGCSPFAASLALLVNPMFMQNASFPWTKHLAALFILQAVYELIKDPSKIELQRSLRAFGCLAIAALIHYSALPWTIGAVILTFAAGTSISRLRHCIAPLFLFGLICSPWFVWSFFQFGFADTVFSNTAFLEAQGFTAPQQSVRVFGNIGATLIPFFLLLGVVPADGLLLRLRETAFCLYQLNLLFAFGSILWIKAGATFFEKVIKGSDRHRLYLLRAVVAVIILSIGSVGGAYQSGLAHIGLQPLVLIGVAGTPYIYHASSPMWRRLILVGACLDILFGVLLHFAFQRELFANGNLELKNSSAMLFAGDLPKLLAIAVITAALAAAYFFLSARKVSLASRSR